MIYHVVFFLQLIEMYYIRYCVCEAYLCCQESVSSNYQTINNYCDLPILFAVFWLKNVLQCKCILRHHH